MERLIRPGVPGCKDKAFHIDSLELVHDFENTAVELYRKILEFQIRLVKQHSRSWAERYGRDVFKIDTWTSLTSQIKSLETKCTELAQDLSRENIERALQDSDRNMQFGLQKIQNEIESTTRGIEQQTLMQSVWRQTDEERRCVQLFRQSNPYEDQKNRTPRRVLETGNWFLENRKFLDWRENDGSDLLWLSAMPGSGKSVLARTLIDEGLVALSHQKQTVVCYFFFKDISPYQRSAVSAMSAILHQLFSAVPSLVEHALISYGLNGKELLSLFDEMFDILCEAAADPAIGQVVCVLDALDECDENGRMRLVEKITSFYRQAVQVSLDRPKLKFLLTSRPYSNIYSQFHDIMKETPTIHLSGDQESEKIKDEIDHVIDVDISKLAARRGFDEEATEYLLEELHKVENRTYLWLSLIMEEIRLSERPANRRELRKIISDLPRSLVDAFDAILKRCRHRELARQLLHIILAAREPLTVDDMRIATALAGDLEYRSYEEIGSESSAEFELRIKNICGLFVTIDGGSVFLIHQTAKEFLIQTSDTVDHDWGLWRHTFNIKDSETLIATICIVLLSFTCFSENPLKTKDKDAERALEAACAYKDAHPFLGYAAENWASHAEDAWLDEDPKWMQLIISLCSVTKPAFETWYTIYRRTEQAWLPQMTTSLNLAAAFDFTNVMAYFLDKGEDPNEPDGHGATPLARAVTKRKKAAQLLLDAGADINAQGWEAPWHSEINENGSEREIKPFTGTPLAMAAMFGHLEMVEYLINRGADINFAPKHSMTPLMAAAVFCESEDICHLLLRHGAHASLETLWGRSNSVGTTALHVAAECSIPSILQIIAGSTTANINCQTHRMTDGIPIEGENATGTYEKTQTESSNKHLFPNDPDDGEESNESITSSDTHGECESDQTVSISDNDNASDNCRLEIDQDDNQSESVSELPIEDLDEHIGLTALHIAIKSKRVENAKVLLEIGADVHIRTFSGHTAMELALNLPDTNDLNLEAQRDIKKDMIALLQQYDHETLPMVSCLIQVYSEC